MNPVTAGRITISLAVELNMDPPVLDAQIEDELTPTFM